MTRNYQNHRVFLNDAERRTLDTLIRRAAPSLGPGESGLLLHLFAHLLGDQQHLQSSVSSLRRECTQLRQKYLDAEADLEQAVIKHRTAEARLARVHASGREPVR